MIQQSEGWAPTRQRQVFRVDMLLLLQFRFRGILRMKRVFLSWMILTFFLLKSKMGEDEPTHSFWDIIMFKFHVKEISFEYPWVSEEVLRSNEFLLMNIVDTQIQNHPLAGHQLKTCHLIYLGRTLIQLVNGVSFQLRYQKNEKNNTKL